MNGRRCSRSGGGGPRAAFGAPLSRKGRIGRTDRKIVGRAIGREIVGRWIVGRRIRLDLPP